MGSRALLCAVITLTPAIAVRAQTVGPPEITGSNQRVVFFSGDVMLEDGSAPRASVLIQQVCNGRTRDDAWTDPKGRFGFKVDTGTDDTSTADASQAPAQAADLDRPIGNSTRYSMPLISALRNCELQAVLAGYRSERVAMALKSTLDNTRVGTIILHPLSKGSALTVSATSLDAPSNAKKAYDKGVAAVREQKWDTASSEFTKAVTAYPKFAAAWYEIGIVRQNQNDSAGAVDAWKEALKRDAKYVPPYESLTALAYRQENWTELEQYSRDWIQLDPEDFAAAYLYSAFANAKLNKRDEAERAAREGLRVDKERKFPRLDYLLGVMLMQKGEYGESAKYFRTYLELAPNAADAALVREQLPKIEAAATAPLPH